MTKTGLISREIDREIFELLTPVDNNKDGKEKAKKFLSILKDLEMATEYNLDRMYHFSYLGSLLAIKEKLDNKDYIELVRFLRYVFAEYREYILQPRFYANLIDILEELERDV